MKEEVNIDKAFREKLEGLSKEPQAFVWDGIQTQLAVRNRERRMFRYSWAAVAALLVLAFVAGWHFNSTIDEAVQQVAQKETEKPAEEKVAGERENSVQPTDAIEAEPRKNESSQFLADATTRKSTQQKTSQEFVPSADVEENILVTSADLEMIERIESLDAKIEGQNQTFTLAGKNELESSTGISEWERSLIDENARETKSPAKDRSNWKMGVNVSPGYSSYTAKHGTTYSSNMTYDANDGNGNLSGGVSVQYKTGKRIRIESGVYYAQNGQQSGSSPQLFASRAEMDYAASPTENYYFNTAVSLANNRMAMNSTAGIIEFEGLPKGAEIAANLESSGIYANSLLTSGELSQVFDFVEIPLYLRYLLVDSKMDVELVGGLNAGLVVGNNAYIDNEYGVQNIGKTRDISTVNISGTLGVGLAYTLGKNFSLAVEPRFNYYMNSINRSADVDFRPYRIGVYTGLYYEF